MRNDAAKPRLKTFNKRSYSVFWVWSRLFSISSSGSAWLRNAVTSDLPERIEIATMIPRIRGTPASLIATACGGNSSRPIPPVRRMLTNQITEKTSISQCFHQSRAWYPIGKRSATISAHIGPSCSAPLSLVMIRTGITIVIRRWRSWFLDDFFCFIKRGK